MAESTPMPDVTCPKTTCLFKFGFCVRSKHFKSPQFLFYFSKKVYHDKTKLKGKQETFKNSWLENCTCHPNEGLGQL